MQNAKSFFGRLVHGAAVMLTLSNLSLAQEPITSGTATVNASVEKSVQLTSGGAITINNGRGPAITANGVADNALAVNFNLGDISPANTNSIVSVLIPLRLRSNTHYQLNLALTSSTGLAGAGAGDLKLSDIGIGTEPTSFVPSGTLATDTGRSFPLTGYSFNPAVSHTTNANGQVTYRASLAQLGSVASAVMTGGRVSQGGTLNAAGNALNFNTVLAIAPQYFTPGTFQAVLTFNVVAP